MMTNFVLAFSLSALLGRPTPTPVATPPAREAIEAPAGVPVPTPPEDLRKNFCRKLVASIPEVCDAPPAEMGGCAALRDQVCPKKGGRP